MTETLLPDVIIMDMEILGLDGIETMREIDERCPTPVVVLSAHEAEHLITGAWAAGAGAYLVKPCNAPGMERAITIAATRFDELMELRPSECGVCRDIAERERIEVALRESELKSRSVVEQSADGIMTINEQGTFICFDYLY